MVGSRPVHIGALAPPPEVAAAQNDADFHAHFVRADELVYHARNNFFVQAEALIARERLARQL